MSEITAEEQNFIYDTVETLVKTNLLSCEEAHELDGACYWEGLNTDGGLILYSVSIIWRRWEPGAQGFDG
jgi:hypothetical protein